ncbi:hypothetical protein SAMN05216267_101143 [Actinacidiphila rubida]|uniref:Tetratricopeptide repeat protein n=2 Tax=Actinacidiphila rubida TaxID=310780 RepID=A0A1H8JUT4_9ACTN|nr:hypothetical protein [Actinacidiphila rubida]SEN83968.1 hypothetical protein SAMN05216267_101143 [Actinacidiphila rubida]
MDGRNVARDDSAGSTHPLAYVRRRHGWSYQDLARVVAEHARALGVPMAARREKVWRWEHWGVVPEADSQRALARALGVAAKDLEERPWPRWLPAHGGMPDGLPWTVQGSRTALVALVDDGSGDPRGYPIADGQALRDAIADWDGAETEGCASPPAPAGPLSERVPAQSPGPGAEFDAPPFVDGPVLDWLEAGVLGLRRLDDRLGGAAVRHRVEADLRLVSGLLGRDVHGAAAQRRLLRVAADLAQLGGWAATDTGRHGAAQRHYLTGLRLAHSAGDRALAVALWGGLSLQSVIAGRPQDAVAAAEAGVRSAGGTPPAVRALAASRLGRAHAAMGAPGAFRRAVAEAERQLDAAEADPGPAWLYWLDDAELAAQAGQSLLDLGQAYEARPLLEQALAMQDVEFVRDRSLYAARAALARAMTGDLEGARSLGREAAGLSRHCGSPRLAAALDALKARLDLHR